MSLTSWSHQNIPGLEVEDRTDWDAMSPAELAQCLRGYEVLLLSRDPRGGPRPLCHGRRRNRRRGPRCV